MENVVSTCLLASIAPFLFLTFPGSEEGKVIALNPEGSCKILPALIRQSFMWVGFTRTKWDNAYESTSRISIYPFGVVYQCYYWKGKTVWEGQSVLVSWPGIPYLGESHKLSPIVILWKCEQQPERGELHKKTVKELVSYILLLFICRGLELKIFLILV